MPENLHTHAQELLFTAFVAKAEAEAEALLVKARAEA